MCAVGQTRERYITTEQDGVVGALLGSDGMAPIEQRREMMATSSQRVCIQMTADGERIVAAWF